MADRPRRDHPRTTELADLLRRCPERETLAGVHDERTLREFLQGHGRTLSIIGTKYLIQLFQDRYGLIGVAVRDVEVSDDALGVVLCNLPESIRAEGWVRALERRKEQRDFLRLQQRYSGNVSALRTEHIESMPQSEMSPEFAAECDATLAARCHDWGDWANRCSGATSWEALWALAHAQPKATPPSDQYPAVRAALRAAITRLRPALDPERVHAGRVLERGGRGTYMALVLAMGVDNPVVARALGYQLFRSARADVNRLRERPLCEVWAVLVSSYLGHDPTQPH